MRYYNERTKELYIEGTAITKRLNGCTVFSGVPSAEQLAEWGFVEIPDEEPEFVDYLAEAKKLKIQELKEYDSSSAVNEFFLGNQSMWLTREERTQIDESINGYEGVGATEMTKYFNGIPYTFSLVQWRLMLNALIVYASEALNITEAHEASINALEEESAVRAYDFTVGYPQKLRFGE